MFNFKAAGKALLVGAIALGFMGCVIAWASYLSTLNISFGLGLFLVQVPAFLAPCLVAGFVAGCRP